MERDTECRPSSPTRARRRGVPRAGSRWRPAYEPPAGYDTVQSTWEGFDQVPSAEIRIYSLPWQIAEKVHAYTDPHHRDCSNPDLMRPRDLLDPCRCATATTPAARLESHELRNALTRTFEHRRARDPSKHHLPSTLPPLPTSWVDGFMRQVEQDALPWKSPEEAHALAARLIDPVLGDQASGTWDSQARVWK